MAPTGVRYFIAYEELGITPNIVVDGMGNAATEITLSHWPNSGTPSSLKADSSAEIVFNYLDRPAYHTDARAVSNNHFDEDGLIGVFTLIDPDGAIEMRDLVIDAAHAGDFATYRDRRAARIAFTVSAFVDPDVTPLNPGIFEKPYAERCADLYREMLPRFSEIASHTDRFKRHWEAQDRALDESEKALREGRIRIEEKPEVDLAVVTWSGPTSPHPMAVHNATRRNRILSVRGRCYAFRYRYESWVQYMSARPAPRVDLTPFAEELSAEEPGSAAWAFDGVSAITPKMTMSGANESVLAPETFRSRLIDFLGAAPAAWNPYDPA